MIITPHFHLEEFSCRDIHRTPYPAKWVEQRLRALCDQLETLRDELGGYAVTIVSGFRTEAYNRSIGGARFSQHVEGRAADIRVEGCPPKRVHDTALQLYRERLINMGGLGRYPSFTHIDIRPGNRLARWEGSRTQS